MWQRLRKLRFPGLLFVFFCVLVPPVVWRITSSSTTTASLFPVVGDAPWTASKEPWDVYRIFVSATNRMYTLSLLLSPPQHTSAGISNAELLSSLRIDPRGLVDVLLGLPHIGMSEYSYQWALDTHRSVIYFYAIGTSNIWEISLDGAQTNLVYSSSSQRLDRGMVLNSRSRHLYFSTRVCAPGEEFSRCVSNRANIIRVKIGLGYIGAPEIVPFEYGEPCYLFFDGDHLLSASLKEAFIISTVSFGGPPSSPLTRIMPPPTNNISCIFSKMAWLPQHKSLLMLLADGIFSWSLGSQNIAKVSELGYSGIAVDQRFDHSFLLGFFNSSRLFLQSQSAIQLHAVTSNLTLTAASLPLNMTFPAVMVDFLAISCTLECFFRTDHLAIDFSNLMVSVVVVLGIAMATGPLLLVYAEKAQRPHPSRLY